MPGSNAHKVPARRRFRRWAAAQARAGSTRTQIAALIGCSEASLCRILSGERGAGGLNAARIERATAGWAEGPILAAEWHPEKRRAA